tara:strand:- start:236 stop:478 length:243 start_codon:yes stop_codon:yes gene_type:complete
MDDCRNCITSFFLLFFLFFLFRFILIICIFCHLSFRAANFIVVAPLTEECTRTGLVWSGKEDEAASKKRKLAALEGTSLN